MTYYVGINNELGEFYHSFETEKGVLKYIKNLIDAGRQSTISDLYIMNGAEREEI